MIENFKQKWHSSAMETETIKNGASLKSQMSRNKIKLFTILAFVISGFVLTGCENEKNNEVVPDNIMASFAKAAYDDNLYRDYKLPVLMPCSDSKWNLVFSRQVENWNPLVSDFWYQIYESDSSFVIAFRGTPPISINPDVRDNWGKTFELILGFNHPQDANVKNEVEKGMIANYLDTAKVKEKKYSLPVIRLEGIWQ